MSGEIRLKIAKRMRELRKKRKCTQERLAELSNVDYKHIQLLESKNPPNVKIETLEKLAKAFNTTISALLNFK